MNFARTENKPTPAGKQAANAGNVLAAGAKGRKDHARSNFTDPVQLTRQAIHVACGKKDKQSYGKNEFKQ